MEAPIKDMGPGPEVAGGGAVLRLLKIQSKVNTNASKNYIIYHNDAKLKHNTVWTKTWVKEK